VEGRGASPRSGGRAGGAAPTRCAGSPRGRPTRRIESELRRRIAQQTEVTLHDVRLMDERWLIKTSSGKLARAANREKYLLE